MKRKLICLVLAALMVFSLASGAMAVNCGNYSQWFAVDYNQMQELGLIPDSFSGLDLTKPISREEMCELAVQAFELATGNSIDPESREYFTDTNSEVINKAYEYGIVDGYTDGTYKPKQNLSRQEFFQIVVNFCTAAAFRPNPGSNEINRFNDADQVAAWARDAANACVKYTFVIGANNKLMPTSSASRQEAMTMFLRSYLTVKEYYRVSVLDAEVIFEPEDEPDPVIDEPEEPEKPEVPVEDVTILNYTNKMYVNTDLLNVRDTWSTGGAKVGLLHQNDRVSVTGICSNGWYRIKYNGATAYVLGEYLIDEIEDDPDPISSDPEEQPHIKWPTGGGSGDAANVANLAMSFVGYDYVYGGTSPSTGFDCSGLVYYCYGQYGYSLYRVADDQMKNGESVSKSQLQIGDLVFFGSGDYASHVGMYIGSGNFVHASTPTTGVRINSLDETYYADRYLGARRIIH